VRYGIPHSIITDNGTNFAKGVFTDFCSQKGIQLDLALVAHPHSNGQVEKVNGLIITSIKPRLVEPLEHSAGCWVKELPSVIWSLCTTTNCYVGFTPFFLVYGVEAMLPIDIEFDAPRVVQYTQEQAKEAHV
jgi:transposase InsO family protein